MKIEHLIRYAPRAVGLMEIEHLIRYTPLAVGLKPSAMRGEARLRGLWRIISSKTIRPRLSRAKPACAGYTGVITHQPSDMVRCALLASAHPVSICIVRYWRSAQPVSIIDILPANVQRLTTMCISGCGTSVTVDPERAILQPSLPGATTNRVHQPAPRRSPERLPDRSR
jgi:hypothetical protein